MSYEFVTMCPPENLFEKCGLMSEAIREVVIIGSVWPESNSSAAGQNMMGIISSFLARQWRVIFMSACNDSPYVDTVEHPLFSFEPITLNCDTFDRRIHALSPDVVIFDRFMTEEQFSARVRQQCPGALRVLNTEDLHSLRASRMESVKAGKAICLNCPVNSDKAHREVAAILRSDLTLVISSVELTLLQEVYQVPSKQLCLLPLFLGSEPISLPDFTHKRDFVFIGNFRHAPNWDAVIELQRLWPSIRKKLSHTTLNIYGAYPPKKAMAMDNPKTGFRVHGWTENAANTVASHRVMLAPLRFGAGIKGKLVLAMQCDTPSVTTRIGAEGITDEANWPGSVVDSDRDFVNSAVDLYTNEAVWLAAKKHGEEVLASQFDNNKNASQLHDALEAALSNLDQWRADLFMQGLLWHHTLRSTQYMSQWIEAKNRLSN